MNRHKPSPKMASAKKVDPPPHPPSKEEDDPLVQPLHALDQALHILSLVARRHKNQHHITTTWWRPLGQLRRQTRKIRLLVPADPQQASIRARAACVGLVPKAYVAFSQLAAHRQFATLGLLLVGVLAMVHSALWRLVEAIGGGDDEEEEEEQEKEKETLAMLGPARDWGEVISREMLEEAIGKEEEEKEEEKEEKEEKEEVVKSKNPKKHPLDDDDNDLPIQSPSKKHKRESEDDKEKDMDKREREEKKDKKERKEKKEKKEQKERKERKEKDKDKKKDKKRKRPRDEFDELFSKFV